MRKVIVSTLICFVLTALQPLLCSFFTADIANAGMTEGKFDIKVKKRFTGNVKEVVMETMTLVLTKEINKKNVDMAFAVNPDTPVVKGEEQKTIADVKKGSKVTVVYVRRGGNFVAEKIFIEP
ncbi:MAG: hypothetical protein AB1390_05390 [Nitrospirota bacterium]